MDFGEYNVKNIKSFMGTDGHGFNATLYRGKKRVATLIDSGCGGEVNIQWLDWKKEHVEIENRVGGKVYKFGGTPEEKNLYDHINSLPNEPSEYFEDGLGVDTGFFLGTLVGETDENNRLRRLCKKKTVVRMKENDKDYVVYKTSFSPEFKKSLEQHHQGGIFEFVNERFR